MSENLWSKILLKLVSMPDSGAEVRGTSEFWRCSRCDTNLKGAFFMAYDRSYCSEMCRVLAVAPTDVIEKIENVLNGKITPCTEHTATVKGS